MTFSINLFEKRNAKRDIQSISRFLRKYLENAQIFARSANVGDINTRMSIIIGRQLCAPTSLFMSDDPEFDKDLARWQDVFPLIIERLNSSVQDVRVRALRALNFQITAQFLGKKIEPFFNELIEQLRESVNRPERCEHDEALGAVCNLCLQTMKGFERYATVILNDILPKIEKSRLGFDFFSVAFFAAFAVKDEEFALRILNQFTVVNKESMRGPILGAMNIIFSAFPPRIVSDYIFDVGARVAACLESANVDQINTALETLLVVNDLVSEYAEEQKLKSDDGDPIVTSCKALIEQYIDMLPQVHLSMQSKAEKRAVKSRCEEAKRLLLGAQQTVKMVLNAQNVTIFGSRNICLLHAIERVTRSNFNQQMATNTLIHNLFGMDLLTAGGAMRVKRQMREEIKTERVLTKKEKEQARMKQRRRKEREDFDNL